MIAVRSWHGGYYTWIDWPKLRLANGLVITWFWWRWCQKYPEDVEFRDAEYTHHRMAA
jgi:hypothetical protein